MDAWVNVAVTSRSCRLLVMASDVLVTSASYLKELLPPCSGQRCSCRFSLLSTSVSMVAAQLALKELLPPWCFRPVMFLSLQPAHSSFVSEHGCCPARDTSVSMVAVQLTTLLFQLSLLGISPLDRERNPIPRRSCKCPACPHMPSRLFSENLFWVTFPIDSFGQK